ncbi:MAG TPA: histidinol-phosphate transaminase [Gammaproteobacteria bacterium]|nr:histidinol-phosphate transaminase [Gammaproteobacteria bacterium]
MSRNQTGDRISRWIRADVRATRAYHVPDATGMIKLDAMENPFGWPADMVDAWHETLRGVELNRYPDPHARQLTDVLRAAMAVPADAGVLLGNGSDELIQMIVMAVAGAGRCVMSLEPGFVMYRIISQLCRVDYVGVPLDANFVLDLDATLAAIAEHEPAVIFIAYPNNPTGNLFDAGSIEQILEAAPGFVVVDEAYHVFAGQSFMPRLVDYPHLLVMRTVSKMGLAGLRLGLLAGNAALIGELDKVRLPYNINVLTQLTARFALQHAEVLDEQAAAIREERTRVFDTLSQRSGLEVFPSQANFILFRTPAGGASAIHAALKAAGILIKNLDGGAPALRDCLRVTIGTREENDAFLAALGEALGA